MGGFGGLTPQDTCQSVMSFLRTLSDPERRDEKEKEMDVVDVVPMVLDKGANHTSNGTGNGTLEMTPVSSNAKIAPARAPAPAPAPAAVPALAPMSPNCTRIRDSIEKVDDIEQRCNHSSTCWPSLKRFIDHNRPIYQKKFEEYVENTTLSGYKGTLKTCWNVWGDNHATFSGVPGDTIAQVVARYEKLKIPYKVFMDGQRNSYLFSAYFMLPGGRWMEMHPEESVSTMEGAEVWDTDYCYAQSCKDD